MNKLELFQAVKNANGLISAEANMVVNLFFGEMADTLANEDRVEIRGLCSFYVKEYKGSPIDLSCPDCLRLHLLFWF